MNADTLMMIDPRIQSLIEAHPLLFVALLLWSLAWKGLALWKSAGLRQKYWFIAILILNTFGLVEIFYLSVISRKYKIEVIEETDKKA